MNKLANRSRPSLVVDHVMIPKGNCTVFDTLKTNISLFLAKY